MSKAVKPYKSDTGKKDQVKQMFNKIAKRYDLLNHTLSLGMDYVWRKKAIKKITNNPSNILDIATGTADFAISAAKHTNAKITGIDISDKMIDIGNNKISKKDLKDRIQLSLEDSEKLSFKDSELSLSFLKVLLSSLISCYLFYSPIAARANPGNNNNAEVVT